MRKAILAIVAIFAIGAILYFFDQFKRAHSPVSDSLRAIPTDAAMILESEHMRAVWDDLHHSNLIWEQLQQTQKFRFIDFSAGMLDSLISEQPMLQELFSNSSMMVSVHPAGATSYDYLFTMSMPPNGNSEKMVKTIMKQLGSRADYSSRQYNGEKIHSIQLTEDYSFHIAFPRDILVVSFSPLLVEDAIKQVSSEYSLAEMNDLIEMRKTTSVSADAHLFVNLTNFPTILASKLTNKAKQVGFFKSALGSWAGYDIHLKSNAVSLNGFCSVGDSTALFLDSFRGQSPQSLSLDGFMPANTAYYAWYGWSNLNSMRRNYLDFLERDNRLYEYDKAIRDLEENCQCDMEELLLSWIGNEAAMAVTEPTSMDYDQNRFLLFEYANRELAERKLGELEKHLNSEEPDTSEYRGYRIGQLQGSNLHAKLLHDAFSGMNNAYYTLLDGVAVFANSENALRVFINTIKADNTLANDLAYSNYRSNLSDKGNITIYSSLSRSPFIYRNLLQEEIARDLEKQTELLREFEASSFQFSYHRDDLFYSNIYLKYNPVYKRQTTSMWELALEGPVRGRPHLVKNHYTKADEIFVQDEDYRIYLISNTGKVLWQRQLDGPIMGEVTQIDVYRNNKLQLLFNTANRIYLVDRNGKNVDGYPRALQSEATAPLAVFDYDNSRHYRILIPTADKKLVMFDGKGKRVGGWQPEKTRAVVEHPTQHLRIGRKDYIFAMDSEGYVYLLNRRGEVRHPMESRTAGANQDELVIQPGDDIASSRLYYGDTLGNAHCLKFNGSPDRLITTGASEKARFTIRDITGGKSKEFVVTDSSTVAIFDVDGSKLWEKEFEESILGPAQVFRFPDDSHIIGLTFPESRNIRLFTESGERKGEMPLFGGTHFALGDMNNDGTMNLVTASRDGYLYAYSL